MLNIFPQTLASGDIFPLVFNFTNPSTGAAIDMTGTTIGLTIKPDPLSNDSNDVDAVMKKDLAGNTTGVFAFSLGPLEAGVYWIDVKHWSNTGARTTIIPSLQLKLIQSVTARALPAP